MRKEQDGAARLSRGAEGAAGTVLFAANLNTASGGQARWGRSTKHIGFRKEPHH